MKYSHYNGRFSAQFRFSSASVLIVRVYHMRLVWRCSLFLFLLLLLFVFWFGLCVCVCFLFWGCCCCCCCCCCYCWCCFGGVLCLSSCFVWTKTSMPKIHTFCLPKESPPPPPPFFVLCLDIFNWRLEIDLVKKQKGVTLNLKGQTLDSSVSSIETRSYFLRSRYSIVGLGLKRISQQPGMGWGGVGRGGWHNLWSAPSSSTATPTPHPPPFPYPSPHLPITWD